jgi:acetyl-CoA synthetase
MLACARLGVIHSVVFGGFSGEACGMRAADSQCNVLITMDGYYRNGKLLDHKAAADIALDVSAKEGHKLEKVLVWRRHAGQNASASPFVKGRDHWIDEVLPNYAGEIVAPIPMALKPRCFSCTPVAAPASPRDANIVRAATWPT